MNDPPDPAVYRVVISSRVVVPWKEGLHMRAASRLVRIAWTFQSTIQVRCRGRVADARSVLSLLILCASMGTPIDIVATGQDEEPALQAVEAVFRSPE